MKKIEAYGSLKDGKLKISYRDRFNQAISTFDGRVKVTVEKLYRKRSGEQNAYYWGVIVNEFTSGYYETTGETITKDEAHEILKLKCNPKELANKKTGETFNVGSTTSQLTTVGMMEYFARCREFINEWFGRNVPEPGEQTEMEL
jgi:hypothetical protein